MDERRSVLSLILVMTTVALVVGGFSMYLLYRTAFREEQARLIETVQSQARLVEAVARFDAVHSRDYSEGAKAATLSQIRDAHERYAGFGKTGEFTLARREGDRIVFLLRHRHSDLDRPQPVPFASELAEPMRRALLGQSGTVVGLDYRGETVLAAYEPMAELGLGIVAKIDLAEIRAPFLRAGIAAGLSAVVVILLGSVLFLRLTRPLLRHLEESEERFRLMSETSHDLLTITDEGGRTIWANPAWRETLGYTPEAQGDPMEKVHPDDRDRVAQAWDSLLQGERAFFGMDYRYRTASGSYAVLETTAHWLLTRGKPALYVASHDLTERKRAEEALRRAYDELELRVAERTSELKAANEQLHKEIDERRRTEEVLRLSESRLEALVQLYQLVELPLEQIMEFAIEKCIKLTGSTMSFLGFIDEDETEMVVQAWSQAALQECEMIDKPIHFPLDEAGIWGEAIRRRRPVIVNEYSAPNTGKRGLPDGHVPLSRLISVPIFEGGKIVGVAAVANKGEDYDDANVRELTSLFEGVWNVVQRKRAEEARRAAEQELEQQRTLSIRSDRLRSLGQMAAGIAHELNQPLQGVRGLADILLTGMDRGWEIPGSETKEKLQLIVEQADRMTHIIEHVRMFSREAGRPDRSPVQINEVAQAAVDLLREQFRSRGIDLLCEPAEGLPLVSANPFSLEEAVINLLTNARDAVEERLQAEDPSRTLGIVVRTDRDPHGSVVIQVIDGGPGIPPSILENVFDPFFTTKDPDKGTGLGLSICKSIVEDIGGAIRVESAPGEGTTVTVSLPARNEDE